MRRLIALACFFCALSAAHAADAPEGHIIKVLPQFLDSKGRESTTPSLYDRDAYQFQLRRKPEQRSAVRYAVQWKAGVAPKSGSLTLRVELRGTSTGNLPPQTELTEEIKEHYHFSHWSYLVLDGEAYKKFGDVTAWRVTFWDGQTLLSEQKSFLW